MREVTAHAGSIGEHVARGRQGGRGANLICDIVTDPLANRLHAAIARRQPAEFAACQREQQIGFTVFARHYIGEYGARHLRKRNFRREFVYCGGIEVDRRLIPHAEQAGRHVHANESICTHSVGEFIKIQRRLRRHRLGANPLRAGVRNRQVENKQCLLKDIVIELRVDMKCLHLRSVDSYRPWR